MIILDTNVLSELMRPNPSPAVLRWFVGQSAVALHVTTISYAEILFGLALLPKGQRKQNLSDQADAMFTQDFAGRILVVDLASAAAYGAICAQRKQAGRRIAPLDAMIAAVAMSRGGAVATRDHDLSGCGVPVINPWDTA